MPTTTLFWMSWIIALWFVIGGPGSLRDTLIRRMLAGEHEDTLTCAYLPRHKGKVEQG